MGEGEGNVTRGSGLKKRFHMGYRHNVEIWKKNKAKAKQKNKIFIKKL